MAAVPRILFNPRFRWRLLLLGAAIVLIVLMPLFVAWRAAHATLEAGTRVENSHAVRSQTHRLMHTVRDLEAASFALAAGLKGAHYRERASQALAQLDPQLARLKELVADDPDQLVRVGQFEATLQGRRRLTEEALLEIDTTARLPIALAALDRAGTEYGLRELAAGIVQFEDDLLAGREARSHQLRATLGWLALGAAAAQLVLLVAVSWLAERQVSQRLFAESDSRKAVSRAQAIFQSVREPIALLDARLCLLMHNDAFAQHYGTPQRAPGDAPPALAEIGGGLWNDAVLLQRLADVAARDRELWDHELRQVAADGVERVLMVNARRMRLPDRDDNVVLMTVADVTAHKRAEQQIRELNRQLEGKIEQVSEVNRELEAFSYSVSHDLRAPLRHVAGFAEKLERHLGENVDERARHYLDVIAGSARRMAGLIDDLLVYSRLGRHALRLQAVDMQSLVDEARQMLSADLGDRSVEWRVQPLPVVVADENMMRQVWQNLLGNAVKYSARRERALVEVSSRSLPDGTLEFTVKDNGAGFDMAYASKLFGVFQRLHKASEFPGSGIGLANVRRILARHGGRIRAESAPDQGAAFHFTLPAQPGTAS
jgi:PAS domain S-box-containing protein